MFMGHTIKAFFAYNRPFWRQAGLMGYALAASPVETHPIDWTLDNCFEGLGPVPSYPHSLMVFMAGKAANIWGPKKPEERFDAALSQLVQIFGPEARSELVSDAPNYHEFDFKTEVLSGGGPTAVMPPGLLTTSGKALRLPDGLIHWAGTEHATNWCGYMDGAIQAGIRAAGAVYTRLSSPVQESASSAP
jgi:monoamine oxidase